jgi:hypothetical protein
MPETHHTTVAPDRIAIRGYLLTLSTLMFAGTLVELYLIDHWHPGIVRAPFAICVLGLAGNAALWRSGNRLVVTVVYYLMAALIAGSLLGTWYHVRWNFRFESQFQPDASNAELLRDALSGGAPFVAPGVLAAAAAISIIAIMIPDPSGSSAIQESPAD